VVLNDCCSFERELIALRVTRFPTPLIYRGGRQDQQVVLDRPVETAAVVAALLKAQDSSIDPDGLQLEMQLQE
jgi:hypothetical protein